MKIIHVDGGAFVEPPSYKFHDAYFSVMESDNSKNGKLVHFEKNIGDVWSGVAEYYAIKWAVENVKERPLTITSDCLVAFSWVKKGKKPTPKISLELPPLDLSEIKLVWQHNNLADIWNAENHSPKYIPREYLKN